MNAASRRRVPVPSLIAERPHLEAGRVVAGIDEVGRGSWAGPVTVGAVVLPTDRRIYKLRDSKRLAPTSRQHLATRLAAAGAGIGIGHASHTEIDRMGLARALALAANRALDALPVPAEVVLIDGNVDLVADRGTHNELIVRGDDRSASIAAASIVAKVDRDARMVAAHDDHPAYDFASNKGYPSPAHRRALRSHGPCALHRRSWAPIAALEQPQLFSDATDQRGARPADVASARSRVDSASDGASDGRS